MENVLGLKITLFPQRYPVLIILIVYNELPCVSVQPQIGYTMYHRFHESVFNWLFKMERSLIEALRTHN